MSIPTALLAAIFLQAQAGQTAVNSSRSFPLIDKLIQSDNGLSFVLNTAVLQPVANGTVQVDGLTQVVQTPGAPMLPYYSAFIAVPPEAEVSVQVTALQATTRAVPALAAAPDLTLVFENADENGLFPAASADSTPPTAAPDPAIYGQDALYPTAVYELSDPMYYRDVRLVQLKLYPVRYNPAQQQINQTTQLQVSVSFSGGNLANLRPSPTPNDAYQKALAGSLLNPDQAVLWRSLPEERSSRETAVTLPIGQPTLKIEVARDGIYEIRYDDLLQAGMLPLNPNTIAMMNRGESVTYQFIGDANSTFDAGETIRFYGWAINESRYDKQLAVNNVFWLWDGAAPTPMATTTNLAGTGQITKTNYLASITREDEKYFFSTWTNKWDQFPNEPDSWYWNYYRKPAGTTVPYTRTEQITLPDPVLDPAQPEASYTIEVFTRENSKTPKTITYDVRGCLNGSPDCGQVTWGQPGDPLRIRSINITNTVPITTLLNGLNNVQIVLGTVLNPVETEEIYLNRITVDYMRHLIAKNNQLQFSDETGGRELWVSGFTENNAANAIVWNITAPHQPISITMDSSDISGNPGNYTFQFAVNQPADAQFIATTTANLLSGTGVITYSKYIPADLSPTAGADWVAISHANFITQAQQLANHRQDSAYGGLSTFVADINDVINQYAYGLPLPTAVHDYLKDALYTWPKAPAYVVLVGDGLISPRHLSCAAFCGVWDTTAVSYIPTDLAFVDRFQGLVPSDLTAVLLTGSDLLPDMAIGRLPVNDTIQAQAVVDKIIRYEQNQLAPAAWQAKILFVADDDDAGGSFCAANQTQTDPLIPDSFNKMHFCLQAATTEAAETLRQQIMAEITATTTTNGASILNYRGHGGIQTWGGSPLIFTVDPTYNPNGDGVITPPDEGDRTAYFWFNTGKPLVLLSADCLDGHFAWPGMTALSERFLTFEVQQRGTAAHWSSSGLGYDEEHTILLNGFYTGLFQHGLTAVGDAVNFAKLTYANSSFNEPSAYYTFNLQGDPAMQLFRPNMSLSKTTNQTTVKVDETAVFQIAVRNDGIYPTKATITDTLPTGLAYTDASASVPFTVSQTGNQVTFTLETGLNLGESAMITVTTTAVAEQSPAINTATMSHAGSDLNPNDNSSSASINIYQDTLHNMSLSKTTSQTAVTVGETATFLLTIYNDDSQATHATITDTLPVGLAYAGASATLPFTVTQHNNQVVFNLETNLNPDESAMITVTTTAVAEQLPAVNTAVMTHNGGDLIASDNTSSASINIYRKIFKVYLPTIIE
ncbi:MAG: DUF11 domain-containing protein [Chloroflexi bacterium]|nr:DUF11 domain-containing protein [Chloroflexota bacterium]